MILIVIAINFLQPVRNRRTRGAKRLPWVKFCSTGCAYKLPAARVNLVLIPVSDSIVGYSKTRLKWGKWPAQNPSNPGMAIERPGQPRQMPSSCRVHVRERRENHAAARESTLGSSGRRPIGAIVGARGQGWKPGEKLAALRLCTTGCMTSPENWPHAPHEKVKREALSVARLLTAADAGGAL